MQLSLFNTTDKDKILEDLFLAYFDARKNKRNTINQLAFEKNLEENIFRLHNEIVNRRYELLPSICFVINKPVKREIFAANFRDRVVHHFIYNYISPVFEKAFINDAYSCRKGKGTHYGISRIDHFIRSCSHNYTKDAYILKLDIKGYFMAINKSLLFSKVKSKLLKQRSKLQFDLPLILELIEKTIFNDPTKDCIIKGRKKDWEGLPDTKSLFHAKKDCGLPIGNLTSQLFGNVYMNDFDHWVKKSLGIKYYGRYVDDFILIHNDKQLLKSAIPKIKSYLKENLCLELHPNKIYLQHCNKGVQFLGAVIKPHYKLIAKRTKGNFYNAVKKHNNIVRNKIPSKEEKDAFQSSMNSYLGILKHYKTYALRKKMVQSKVSAWWWNYFRPARYKKYVPREKRACKG